MGRDLRAARACRGGTALQPAASSELCPKRREPRWGHPGRCWGTAPRTPAGPSERPAAPSVSRSTSSRRVGGGQPESWRLGSRRGRLPTQNEGPPPVGFEAQGPRAQRAPTQRDPRFTWSGDGAGGSPDRAGGLEGAASALPHLGGSERPRVTAPHLASPPLAPTSLPGAGRRVGAGGGA